MHEQREGTVPSKEKTSNDPSLEVLHMPDLRISSANFARIRGGQGRFALLVNRSRLRKGITILTPIGGGIEATQKGIEVLKQRLEIDDEAFERGNDLRFRIHGSKANVFREWFLSADEREINPVREVEEELVEEEGLLTAEDVAQIEYTQAGYATELAQTNRQGQEGQITLRLLEIFDTTLPADSLQKLVDLSHQPDAMIKFVSEDEIRAGKTVDGIDIGAVTKSILDPTPTIPEFS